MLRVLQRAEVVARVGLAALLAVVLGCGEDTNGMEEANGEPLGNVAGIKIAADQLKDVPLVVGMPVVLVATPVDKDGNVLAEGDDDVVEVLSNLEWNSSDESIATVEVFRPVDAAMNQTAQVTPKKAGKVTITVRYKDRFSDSISLEFKSADDIIGDIGLPF